MTGLVTATSMNTYFGKTVHIVEQAKTVSHFQRALLRIGKRCFDPIFKFPCARAIIRGVIWRSACAYARA